MYVCVQSESLSDLVLNTVALEFLLTLDDNCIDTNKALLNIKLISQSAAKQMVYEGICRTNDPMIVAQLSHDETESENRKITRDALERNNHNKNEYALELMKITPGLRMVANYNKAIHSPISLDQFIHYPEVFFYSAYLISREVFFVHALGEVSQIARHIGTQANKVRRASTTLVTGLYTSDVNPTIIDNEQFVNQKGRKMIKAPSMYWRAKKFCIRSFYSLSTFLFFGIYIATFLWSFFAFVFFLPLKIPMLLGLGGMYITAYATKCI